MQTVTCSHVTGEGDKIFRVVDRVLTQLFGAKATRLIYRYLEQNYSLRRDEIGERIDVFAKGLEDFLSSGACVVERKILEDLRSSFGLVHESESMPARFDFVDQMRFLTGKA